MHPELVCEDRPQFILSQSAPFHPGGTDVPRSRASSDTVRPGTSTKTGDLERDKSEEDGVESNDPDDDAAGDRDGVHSADVEVEQDDEEDEC